MGLYSHEDGAYNYPIYGALRLIAILVLAAGLLLCLPMSGAAQNTHPVPTDRSTLTGAMWFPYVVSKIAPLEWWTYEESTEDIQPGNYSDKQAYETALRNTWEFPRFCFRFFRPSSLQYLQLREAALQYHGTVYWMLGDDCMMALADRPAFYASILGKESEEQLEELVRNPPKADPQFVAKAVTDIPQFCAYLEHQLHLEDKPVLDFDSKWLTFSGLQQSRPEFDDFFEKGDWAIFLVDVVPNSLDPRLRTNGYELGFGPTWQELESLANELGAQWKESNSGKQVLLPQYPLLMQLLNSAEGIEYEHEEVEQLLAECRKAERHAMKSDAVRGLDKLTRIARWAEKVHSRVRFEGDLEM